MKSRTGASILCSTLEQLGATHVFGVPGTQNVSLFEALRTSSLRTILCTSELSASMMANGYYRASGKVGVLATIPGPGLTFAIPGIAEASLDSAAVLCIVGKPASTEGKQFAHQAIDQYNILKPLVRSIVEIDSAKDIQPAVVEAYAASTRSEPGPVLLHVNERVMSRHTILTPLPACNSPRRPPDPASVAESVRLLSSARRIIIYAGQGAAEGYQDLRRLAELLNAPLVPTRSARGIVPDDHPLSLIFDDTKQSIGALNSLLRSADLVIAVGCKFSHNGSYGFRLQLDPSRLIHVDSSPESLNTNYPAQLSVCADAALFLGELLSNSGFCRSADRGWSTEELNRVRRQAFRDVPEPVLPAVTPSTPKGFFDALRSALPDYSCVVTDSGQHQVLTTRHFRARAPRGLIIPSDFQSMGFGVPAAIGAKLADPDRTVVALIGDGGLLMCGMEIATAVRERLQLVVVVFKDQALGQIREKQLSYYGQNFATDLFVPDLRLFAQSMGANYHFVQRHPEADLREIVNADGVTIVEVSVETSARLLIEHTKGVMRNAARTIFRFIGHPRNWRGDRVNTVRDYSRKANPRRRVSK